MTTTTKAPPIYLDLSKPRAPHSNPTQKAMSELRPGDEYVHDHSHYQTPFSVWIAQNRHRLNRPFQYRPHGTRKGLYIISVPEVAEAGHN